MSGNLAPSPDDEGQQMHELLTELFPICRSITGNGVRDTLKILGRYLPIRVTEVPSGTEVFDWTVPREWNIRDAYIEAEDGRKVVDLRSHNLHVVGYSVPTDVRLSLEELQGHLHSLEDAPEAIPYVTSYYKERWGFCLSHRERLALRPGRYRAVIDSSLQDGNLTYGEWILPGESNREVFLSTYVCHPSMANNELSGPVVLAFLCRWLSSAPRRYTYRVVFVPETIGSITYLSRHWRELKDKVVAAFNVSCVGDDRAYSYVESRYGNTLADRIADHVMRRRHPGFVRYSFLQRGSDERQYCSPGIDLPLVTLCRSKYGTYPEYHTSLDDLKLVTPQGLTGGLGLVRDCVLACEQNRTYRVNCLAEPQLGRRGLYPDLSTRGSGGRVRTLTNLIAYADGANDLLAIADRIGEDIQTLHPLAERLVEAELFVKLSGP